MLLLADELKPHLDAIKEKIREHGPLSTHAHRTLVSVENVELQAKLHDKRERYLAETIKPVKDTILLYLEGDKDRPIRKNIVRITAKHIIVSWHESRHPEHCFSLESGYSLERPTENGRRDPHRLDAGELHALQQGLNSLRR